MRLYIDTKAGGSMAKFKTRQPMMVSDDFDKKIKELQKKMRKETGENPSLRLLTDDIVRLGFIDQLEKKLLEGSFNMDIKIKMDTRRQK